MSKQQAAPPPPDEASPAPDEATCEAGTPGYELLMAMSRSVRDYLAQQPYSHDRVLAVLNALSCIAATVASGTGQVNECWEFINCAFEDQVELCERVHGELMRELSGGFGKGH